MAINPQLKVIELRPSKAPNLPTAPVQYTQQYQDQILNALRLYFNQIDNFNYSLTGNSGGSFLYFPFISAFYYCSLKKFVYSILIMASSSLTASFCYFIDFSS